MCRRLGQALDKGQCRRFAVHVATLMQPALIVAGEIVVEPVCITSWSQTRFVALRPGGARRATMQALDDVGGLQALDSRGALLDHFQPQSLLTARLR